MDEKVIAIFIISDIALAVGFFLGIISAEYFLTEQDKANEQEKLRGIKDESLKNLSDRDLQLFALGVLIDCNTNDKALINELQRRIK